MTSFPGWRTTDGKMEGSRVDELNSRLQALEKRVYGEHGNSNDKPVKCVESLARISSALANTANKRERVKILHKKIEDLLKYVDPQFTDYIAVPDAMKLEFILAEEDFLRSQAALLEQVNNLQPLLDSPHIKGMDEEENTERKLQIAMLCQKLEKIKRYYNDDDTDNINQIISSNSPDTCRTFLTNLEKKGNPQSDPTLLSKLMDCYTRVFLSMPLGKHSQNLNYARMLVRFAELKAIQDANDARDSFDIARSHCKDFAFVHIACAQFELSQGNERKCALILQQAIEMGAKPWEALETAVQNVKLGKSLLLSQEDKENVAVTENLQEPIRRTLMSKGDSRKSDVSSDFHLASGFSLGSDQRNDSPEVPTWYSSSQKKRTVAMPGRIPMLPLSIPESENENIATVCKPQAPLSGGSLSRPTYRSGALSSSKKCSGDGDSYNDSLLNLKPLVISPELHCGEDVSGVDSTTALLHRPERKDTTEYINQIMVSNSPETCYMYLRDLETANDPRTDAAFRSKLLSCYSKVFIRFPLAQYRKLESYARMLVRYAELKGIEDPDEAEDNFIIARANSKAFAFVHIAHAQFELSQDSAVTSSDGGNREEDENQLRITTKQAQPKAYTLESLSEWKIPSSVNRQASPEDHKHAEDLNPTPRPLQILRTPSASAVSIPSRVNQVNCCQTPKHKDFHANSFVTPVVKQRPAVVSVPFQRVSHTQFPCTPQNQGPVSSVSNESITIKGRQFFILKMIGRGGSSKVYQVLDEKKHLYAVKYVNLEEADAQTVESYKNEIEHLNHLQQYSDQIIKLYDYEITDSYIYMLMECGNLDLNTWLRNRKTVNPLERKFYWRNMLEAVQTIHKHGIVHSDLKPANFVIVNASLKLIDFGIANHIQPDMTSVMKDSQVGTLNYMPPEAIKDTSSKGGKPRSKISPKGDIWSLGCILYCMTYGKTPFQNITNQISKIHAIIDPSHEIDFPDIPEKDLLDVLKRCLVRNPKERISIVELLNHSYLQLQPQKAPEPVEPCNNDLKRILNELAALQSPNSIARAASNLAKMCNSGKKLDVSECVRSSSQSSWK
ncbi:Dual specificity protein kinase Ttk [Bagarius yarrelli]|uniref:Dual specificity protein kinase Ttk n=1 Tax=Bagarius yarrelli TaxID=175774 RepID=A0A556V8Q1_BAGYA|nr:Dual specificity protein kinase Ttk [Bagarius yarrelli]